MKLVFDKSGNLQLGCSVVPPTYLDTELYDVASFPEGEKFDPRYSYSCVEGIAVRGELIPVDLIEEQRIQAEFAATQYQRDRASAYPSFAEQFDVLYHGGYDAWKSMIDGVKSQYPKP